MWPSSVALARMVSFCPSFVKGMKVLELGCGLGAVGLAAAKAGAYSVLLTDRDENVLKLAGSAAEANGVAELVDVASLRERAAVEKTEADDGHGGAPVASTPREGDALGDALGDGAGAELVVRRRPRVSIVMWTAFTPGVQGVQA